MWTRFLKGQTRGSACFKPKPDKLGTIHVAVEPFPKNTGLYVDFLPLQTEVVINMVDIM